MANERPPRNKKQVTVRMRPAEKDLRQELLAEVPGTHNWTTGARMKAAPPPEKQLRPKRAEADEDGLDALDLMERGGLR